MRRSPPPPYMPWPLALYLAALLVGTATLVAMVLIGGDDADSDGSGGSRASPVPDASYDALPGPPWSVSVPTPTPTPTPGPTDVPEPATSVAEAVAVPKPERAPEPQPEPAAAGTLVEGIQLTVYTCVGDSTGAYCPGDPTFCGGTVYRGVAACGWQWSCGQRFRILGDPFPDMVYTCLDRGGAVTGIDVWFMDYLDPATQAWRNALPGYVTVELIQ